MEKFVRNISIVLSCLVLAGCASVRIPNYLQERHPYVQRYYANYNEAFIGVKEALVELGWETEQAIAPGVYERQSDAPDQEILIITKVRQTSMIIGTRYARMNIYVRTKADISEIEIRYFTNSSVGFHAFTSYRNDSAVRRIFNYIAKSLKKA